MRNPNKPFFYRKKKNPLPILLLILVVLGAGILWISKVPSLRKIIFPVTYKVFSYGGNLLEPLRTPDPRLYRIQTIVPTVELPSKEVIFAENLEDLAVPDEGVLELPTPTPTSEVFWIFQDEIQDAALTTKLAQEEPLLLSMPAFEQQDLFNDVPTAISTILRFYGKIENQYSVSTVIKPDAFDPTVSFEDLTDYLAEKYPEYLTAQRIGGSAEMLRLILSQGYPVLIRLQVQDQLPAWQGDDLWNGRMMVVYGFDPTMNTFTLIDPAAGSEILLETESLLERWYPFARELWIIYPQDGEEQIKTALGEDWSLTVNLERASAKFQQDVSMIPENRFAWLNFGRVLTERGEYEIAQNAFRSADQLGIPMRYPFFDLSIIKTAFYNGAAYEVIDRSNFMIQINSHCEECWLWKGWGNYLRSDLGKTRQAFQKAAGINPNSTEVRYAIEFLNQVQ